MAKALGSPHRKLLTGRTAHGEKCLLTKLTGQAALVPYPLPGSWGRLGRGFPLGSADSKALLFGMKNATLAIPGVYDLPREVTASPDKGRTFSS